MNFINKLFRKHMEDEKKNTGNRNTGDWNTGNWNTGNRNTGDWNTGNRNTGDRNTGDRNTGNWNTGDLNTGDWNNGDRNTGNWNTGYRNTGYLNTGEPKVRIFNKETDTPRDNISFPNFFWFDLTEWIYEEKMSDKEKEAYPTYVTTGGYLKFHNYKTAFQSSWAKASLEDKKKVLALPNWNNDIFKEISGIDVEKEFNGNSEAKKKAEELRKKADELLTQAKELENCL